MQLSALTYLSSISFPRGRLDGTRRRGKFPPTGGRATGRKCGGGFYLAPRNPKSFGISTLPIPANRPNSDQNSHLGKAQPHREGENVARLRRSGLLGVGNGKAPRKHLGGAARLRMPGSVQQQKPANWRSQIRLRSGDKRLRWFLCR